MDISFKTERGRFNYRVCGIIVHQDHLLTMHDGTSSYSYLPGGRVKLHETAEEAIQREICEEMGCILPILRPLWFAQAYFTEETNGERFHEICLYYLLDGSVLADKDFVHHENSRLNRFEWVPFGELKNRHLYPEFIKEHIFHLPEHMEIIVENSI